MALSITVHGQGTFTASMEEGPVTFTAAIASVGPQGATGATGATGVVAATAPITYDSGTQTVGISATPTFTSVTATTGNLTTVNLTTATFADATSQTTAFIGEARKEYIIARNSTGTTIGAGKVVYLSGATGNKPTVALALADAEATSARTIGVTAESIANNADGKVIISGAVENIDTSAFTAGDTLYLSATTAGGYTTSLPAAPLHGVVIGIVTRSNPSVGSIEVAIQNYQELKELSDVNVSDRANNDGLFWESSSSTWRSKTIAEVLGYTPANAASVLLSANNLSDLASASTARTNLGLGTMAVETAANYLTSATASTTYQTQAGMSAYLTTATASSTYQTQAGMSSYALLASPTFTGDPKAPTPATSDNDTSIATTAFVNAYCPTASTSTAGKVQLATDAQAQAGTSTTLGLTPKAHTEALVARNWHIYYPADFSTATSGTGGVNGVFQTGSGRFVYGPTSSGVGYVSAANFCPPRQGSANNQGFDWSKPLWFSFKVIKGSGTSANSFFRCIAGGVDTVYGDPTSRCIGIRVSGSNAAELIVHNGTSLTAVTSSFTISSTCADVELYSDGAGNVTMYVNGSSVATTANGPSAIEATTNARQVVMQVTNDSGFTSGQQQFLVWMPITKTLDR